MTVQDSAFCGLNCSKCPAYIAAKTDNEELKDKLAKEYSTDSFKFEKDDMTCTGSHSTEGVNEKMCVKWPMRKCGMEKKLAHCAECNEYPCQHIEGYVPAGSENHRTLDGLVKKR